MQSQSAENWPVLVEFSATASDPFAFPDDNLLTPVRAPRSALVGASASLQLARVVFCLQSGQSLENFVGYQDTGHSVKAR